MDIQRVIIICTNKEELILESAISIKKKLVERGIVVSFLYGNHDMIRDPALPDEKIDMVFAVGGDGTALRAARICAFKNVPILPVKMGRFGFINEILINEWEEEFDNVLKDKAHIGNYHLLEVNFQNRSWLCFNDVSIVSAEYGTISASIRIHDSLVTRYRADGLIITTPTGSTGHSLAAGGPIITPRVHACMITPIAPFSLSNRPIILSIEHPLIITIEPSRYHALLVLDGKVTLGLFPSCQISVKDSTRRVKIIHSSKRTYFDILREKLHWSGEFRA